MAIAAFHAPVTRLPSISATISTSSSPDLHPFLRFGAGEERGSLAASSDGHRRRWTVNAPRRSIGRASCSRSGSSSLVTAATWKGSVLSSKLPVLVEFFTAWCGPCRMVDRVIDEIAEEYAGRIMCFKVNADHYPQLAKDHDVERVPTVLVFKDGQKLESIIGTMPKSVYIRAIEKTLA